MEHLDCPSSGEWEHRREWFESVMESAQGSGSYLLSEQGCALTAEAQACFCAGAWIAVVVLCMATIEAQLRGTGSNGGAKKLIDDAALPDDFHRLRQRRNALMHGSHDSDALTVDDQWSSREVLRADAEGAVRLMLRALFLEPGT